MDWIFQNLRISDKQVLLYYNGREVQHLVRPFKPYIQGPLYVCTFTIQNSYSSSDQDQEVLVKEFPYINGPRNRSTDFVEAEKEELEGLMKLNCWKSSRNQLFPKAFIPNRTFFLQ